MRGLLGNRGQPPLRPPGHQDQPAPGVFHQRERGSGPRRDGAVRANDGAVEIGGDDGRTPELAGPGVAQVHNSASNSRSRTAATPSSLLLGAISSATASSSGWALATATPCPAHTTIGTSAGMSPNATTCVAGVPNSLATSASPFALFRPAGSTSTMPPPLTKSTTLPAISLAAAAS